MKTKHTPGKWETRYQELTGPTTPSITGPFVHKIRPYKVVSIKKKTIAIIPLPENNNNDELEANAKLIAAAPELLENLIRCVDRLEENDMGNMSAVRRAKEAIKKATE